MILAFSSEEERRSLILREETIQKYNYDPLSLGRHSKLKIIFKCVICSLPHENTIKLLLDKKGITHPGECRHTLKQILGKQARQNEDPIHKQIRKQKLQEKIAADKDKIIAKRQKTLVEKYGSKNLSKIPQIRENISKGVQKAYLEKGCQIVDKRKSTNLERYNSTNFLTSERGIQIVAEMSQRLFGTPFPFQNKQHRLKAIKYQIRHMSNGITTYDFINSHQNAKYINRYIAYSVYDNLGEQAFIDFCEKIPSKTNLELLAEKAFNLTYFNRFPLKEVRYKPDFIINKEEQQIFINVDGLYWHSELEKSNDYHFSLRKNFEEFGLRILQFREDEVYNKTEIVNSIISTILHKKNITKYNARSCLIKKVETTEARLFFESNHLMGYASSSCFGLYSNQELVAAISVKNIKGNSIEITRFGSKNFTQVRGGFSKLLNHVIKKYNPTSVVSFCDLRYADGHSYEKLGFKLVSISQGWQWTDFKNTFNRLKCRANMDNRGLSEKQHAEELGWYKIYDAGQAKYALILKS